MKCFNINLKFFVSRYGKIFFERGKDGLTNLLRFPMMTTSRRENSFFHAFEEFIHQYFFLSPRGENSYNVTAADESYT
jgi:hypothetical protein